MSTLDEAAVDFAAKAEQIGTAVILRFAVKIA